VSQTIVAAQKPRRRRQINSWAEPICHPFTSALREKLRHFSGNLVIDFLQSVSNLRRRAGFHRAEPLLELDRLVEEYP
jgi:hypothetical protein